MAVPRLGVKLEMHLPAYATFTAKATWGLSWVCNLHHSSWEHQILNPVSEASDWIHILMDTSQVHNLMSHNGNSSIHFPWTATDPYYYLPTPHLANPVLILNHREHEQHRRPAFWCYWLILAWMMQEEGTRGRVWWQRGTRQGHRVRNGSICPWHRIFWKECVI